MRSMKPLCCHLTKNINPVVFKVVQFSTFCVTNSLENLKFSEKVAKTVYQEIKYFHFLPKFSPKESFFERNFNSITF